MYFKIMILLLWSCLDFLLFRWSRLGLIEYFFTPVIVAGLIALVILLFSKTGDVKAPSWRSLFVIGILVKLALFHWYIIPFVYDFHQREEWLLEAMHNAVSLLFQSMLLLLFLALGRSKPKTEG